MRLLVTGTVGQAAMALRERGRAAGVEVIAVGRPDFDLAKPGSEAALLAVGADVMVGAAAHTAVDKAESEPALTHAINAEGAGRVAAVAAHAGIPFIQLSSDYVFDGSKDGPYVESDPTAPLGAYGRSKLAGEVAVAAATANHVILRTAWIYSPFGANFLKTMLRLAAERPALGVVADQHGNPTSALDLADAVLGIAANLVARPDDATLRGVFHLCGSGEASWADFASAIFAASAALGGPSAMVNRIGGADYPTPAQRPTNSCLSGAKVQRVHGVTMPHWVPSTRAVVARLLAEPR